MFGIGEVMVKLTVAKSSKMDSTEFLDNKFSNCNATSYLPFIQTKP